MVSCDDPPGFIQFQTRVVSRIQKFNRDWYLGFGIWYLVFGIWFLVFGIWNYLFWSNFLYFAIPKIAIFSNNFCSLLSQNYSFWVYFFVVGYAKIRYFRIHFLYLEIAKSSLFTIFFCIMIFENWRFESLKMIHMSWSFILKTNEFPTNSSKTTSISITIGSMQFINYLFWYLQDAERAS